MGAKSKSRKTLGGSRKRGARPADAPEPWEQTAQVPDEREGEIDCQRIVQGEGGRTPPLQYDDYN